MSEKIQAAAPKILELIKASSNILLHCHPFPDSDSIASALATKAALEQLGKKVTVIRGDNVLPQALSHFPGFEKIINKNFFEINTADFDLFIIQDSAAIDRISALGPIIFPPTMKTVVIDHHISNVGFAKDINLIEPEYAATALILFDLFKLWNIKIEPTMAGNLFMGMYTDTGGFKYVSVKPNAFSAAAELVSIYPDFYKLIFQMENCRRPNEIIFQGIALSHIETFFDGHVVMAIASHQELVQHGITEIDTSSSILANFLKSAIGWDIGVGLVENEPGKVKVSFRTRDSEKYDLSLIATALGGGGHKAAASAVVSGTVEEVKKKVIDAIGQTMLLLQK